MAKNNDFDIKTLTKNYVIACLNRENLRSKPYLGNIYFDEIQGYYKILKEVGLLNELKPLLFHENIAVQLSAASHLLAIDVAASKKVLVKIMELELGENSFTAKMTPNRGQFRNAGLSFVKVCSNNYLRCGVKVFGFVF